MAAPKAVRIELSEGEAAELALRLRRRKVARADAMRAEIVLPGGSGHQQSGDRESTRHHPGHGGKLALAMCREAS